MKTNELKREWAIYDSANPETRTLCETVMASNPQEAFDLSVNCDKAAVCLPGETECWTPNFGNAELYAAFRAYGFSHSEVARALHALGYNCKEKLLNKGGDLSAQQQSFVAKLTPMSHELRMTWARKAAEFGALRDQRIHAQVREDMAREDLKKWLERPLTEAQKHAEDMARYQEEEAEGTVAGLPDDEAVDVVYGRDGISDDCFTTDAGALKRAGFGNLKLDGENATVWVSRKLWARIEEATQ